MRQVIGVLFFSGIVSTGIVLAQTPGPVSAPAIKAGDTWTFKRTDRVERVEDKRVGESIWRVVAADDKTYEIEAIVKIQGSANAPVKLVYSRDGGWLQFGNTRYDPAQTNLSFPLQPGKEWGGRYKYPSSQTSETVDAQMDAKALDWESVTVPAGTFKALKIAYTGRWGMMRGPYRIGGEFVRTGWYVPEIRQFARWENKVYGANAVQVDVVLELASFKLVD